MLRPSFETLAEFIIGPRFARTRWQAPPAITAEPLRGDEVDILCPLDTSPLQCANSGHRGAAPMTIIDSQVHAYEANTPKRPWHSVPNWPDHVTGDEMVAAMDKEIGRASCRERVYHPV